MQQASQQSFTIKLDAAAAPVAPPAPHWTAYVSSVAVPLIAAVAALIAYRQFRIAARQIEISAKQSEISLAQAETARNKLKLDLFEKRMAVYEAARKAIGRAASQGPLSGQEEIDYLSGVNSAKWLFDQKIADYLEKDLWKKLAELQAHDSMSKSHDPDERNRHIVARSDTVQWLADQYEALDKLCAPYLQLGH